MLALESRGHVTDSFQFVCFNDYFLSFRRFCKQFFKYFSTQQRLNGTEEGNFSTGRLPETIADIDRSTFLEVSGTQSPVSESSASFRFTNRN